MAWRLGSRALAALALIVAAFQPSFDGPVVSKAYAGKGGNGHGNGASNSNSNSGKGKTGDNNSTSVGTSSSASTANASIADFDNYVNALTGDKVEVNDTSIEVTHRNGMMERIENGRFRMEDKFGRTIVDRRATMADFYRLNSF